ncbi:DUF6630 family protein [Saccharothrix xinjiangensis]|uniref:DUF6630 domain-containing protein n=1 Tax=Saccharothrix xinjiangensis TaxID=204798 RepID=A0ABV9YAV0_9PSEU
MDLRSWFRRRPPAPPALAPEPPPPPPVEAYRPLVELLADPLPEPWRSSRWEAFLAAFAFQVEEEGEGDSHVARWEALIAALQHPGEPDWWLAFAVDWKDGQEAVAQAAALAEAHGVTEPYAWTRDAPPCVPDVLEDFSGWVRRHDLRYVRWERDADAYYGFVLRPEQVPEWERLTAELGLHG